MTIFYRSSYTFNKTNSNYINALKKYQKLVHITAINGTQLPDQANLYCRDLPSILNDLKKDQIILETRSGNSSATAGVFPEIKGDILLSGMDEAIKEKSLATINKYIDGIAGYIDYNSRNKTDRAMMQPCVPELSKEEVFMLLQLLNVKLSLSGAIHLPSLKTIIFQNSSDHSQNYALEYGNEYGFSSLPLFSLDIDDGFYDKDADEPSPLMRELNHFFRAWKNKDYTGDMFPASETVVYDHTKVKNDSNTLEYTELNKDNGFFTRHILGVVKQLRLFDKKEQKTDDKPAENSVRNTIL